MPLVAIAGGEPPLWPILAAAFPQSIASGEELASYIHFDAEAVEPAIVRLLDEQRAKEMQEQQQSSSNMLELLRQTLSRGGNALAPFL